MPQAPGPLGFITPADRNPAQHAAHAAAEAMMPRFALAPPVTAGPVKVVLSDFWHAPEVVADTGIDFDRAPFHQLTGSCLPANAPVRMADGSEKLIAEICVGDWVVSHYGRHRQVVAVQKKNTNEQMRSIRVRGWADRLQATDGHLLPVWDGGEIVWRPASDVLPGDLLIVGGGPTRGEAKEIDVLDWVDGCDLSEIGHYTYYKGKDVSPTHRRTSALASRAKGLGLLGKTLVTVRRGRLSYAIPRRVPVTAAFARWVGLYLAEGCASDHRVTFALGREEGSLAEEIVQLTRGIWGLEAKIQKSASRPGSIQVRVSSLTLVRFMKRFCPGKAHGKRVPPLFFRSEPAARLALVGGWFDGDGHATVRTKGVRLTGVSASRGMIRDMAQLTLSCGLPAATRSRAGRGISKPAGEFSPWPGTARAIPSGKIVALPANVTSLKNCHRMTPFGMARRVVENAAIGVPDDYVYDIEVEQDHSFIVWGFVVHNCVGAGGGNALYTLICVQRMLNEGATKAFVPWWPFNYGRSRLFMGDHGRGEGSMGSTFAKSVREDGVTSADEAGLPGFQKRDGYELTSGQEMEWSDGDSRPVIDYLDEAKPHPLGSATPLRSPQDMKAAVLNGYPGTIACNNYIGNASVQGSGDKARVIGHWNGRGGHQQWFFGYEDHPDFGPLYAVGNNWPRGTYPKDPGGLPLVCCWVLEKKVVEMFRLDAEVYLFSHLPWAPAQPKVLDFSSI